MPCPICNDLGWVKSDKPFTDKRCACKVREALRERLAAVAGHEILRATVIKETPLLELTPEGKITTDLTKENLFVETSWKGFLPHLRRVLWLKGLTFHCRVVDDAMIKDVYLSHKNAKSRTSAGIDGDIYNSMDDLVGETVDLVVVRFGCLTHAKEGSTAAGNIIMECFNLRRFRDLPTWAISDPNDDTFNFQQSKSYSANLQVYFDKAFKKIAFETARDDVTSGMERFFDTHESAEEAPTIKIDLATDEPRPVNFGNTLEGPGGGGSKEKPWERPGPVSDSDTLVGPGGGKESKPKFKKKWH